MWGCHRLRSSHTFAMYKEFKAARGFIIANFLHADSCLAGGTRLHALLWSHQCQDVEGLPHLPQAKSFHEEDGGSSLPPPPSLLSIYYRFQFVKDWHLMLVILGFVAADLAVLIIVMALESARYSVAFINNKLQSDSLNVGKTYRQARFQFFFYSICTPHAKPHKSIKLYSGGGHHSGSHGGEVLL